MMVDLDSFEFCLLGDLLGDALSVYLCNVDRVTYVELEEYLLNCDSQIKSDMVVKEDNDAILSGLRGELLVLLCNQVVNIAKFGDLKQGKEFSKIREVGMENHFMNPFCYLIEFGADHDVHGLLCTATFKVTSTFKNLMVEQIRNLNRTLH